MGRRGKKASHLALIQRSGGAPEAVIRSTILLGYPGEDEIRLRVIDFSFRRSSIGSARSFIRWRRAQSRRIDE